MIFARKIFVPFWGEGALAPLPPPSLTAMSIMFTVGYPVCLGTITTVKKHVTNVCP